MLPVTDVCRLVTCKWCSPGIFFGFLLSPTLKMIDGLLSFSFVACHNPRFALRVTVHDLLPGRRCIRGLPCRLRVGMMLTRRSCMGIRGRLRLAPALAQATFTARMFICLHCDHTCLQKSLLFAPRGGRFA